MGGSRLESTYPAYQNVKTDLGMIQAAHNAAWPAARASKRIIVLDCETMSDRDTPTDPSLAADIAEACAAQCPESKRMAYGAGGGPWTRIEDFNSATDDDYRRCLSGWERFLNLMDLICVSPYLIDPNNVDRDIAAIDKIATMMAVMYPRKQQVFAVFGVFNWEPYPPLTPDAIAKWAKVIEKHHGYAIVEEPTAGRDDAFIAAMAQATGTR